MNFDFNTYTKDFISSDEIKKYASKMGEIKHKFETNVKELEWFQMGEYIDNMELKEIKEIAKSLKENTDVLLVVGIGGSYMGSKAILSALKPYFGKDAITIIYVGTSLSSLYYEDLLNYLQDKRVSMNVISKSGNTMETITMYQLLMKMMKKRYSKKELRKRIFLTTNIHEGKLLDEAKENGYRTFFIPDNIPGRYSIFTPVSLFPLAVADIDIIEFLKGAKEARMYLNHASIYAMVRKIMFDKEKIVEAYCVYEPKLYYFTEWLKQLFAESEGKDCKGILPTSVVYTRDLHSLGQFIAEGNPILFETIFDVETTTTVMLEKYNEPLEDINHMVATEVCVAHQETGCPSNFITIPKLTEYHLGEACMFFMIAAAMSAYLFEVNPFDQPGVKLYKDLVGRNLRVLK